LQGLPHNVESIASLVARNPSLARHMKVAHPQRFEQVGFVITSQPTTHPDTTVYGVFLVDKLNVAKNAKGKKHPSKEVVQDFLAHDRVADTAVYYCGQGVSTVDRQHITSFCAKFGRDSAGAWGQYGCASARQISQHRYDNEHDPGLPIEVEIRTAIATTPARVRAAVIP
jgi:hypothetical protein